MEVVNIAKEQCQINRDDNARLMYNRCPLMSLCSEPQPTAELALASLAEIEKPFIEKSDGQFKYLLGEVKVWDSAQQMAPPGMFVAYETVAFSGIEV